MPLGTPPFTLEHLQKVRQTFPSADKFRSSPFVALVLQEGEGVLGFRYDDFRKSFEDAEILLGSAEVTV